jgi:hypothetical protein
MHTPARFASNRAAWLARKTIVARRKATKAAREGRAAWAARWDAAALACAEAWRDYLDAR